MNRTKRLSVVVWTFVVLLWPLAAFGEDTVGSLKLQKDFADAYNRKDSGAMAAAFTEDAIRVTPSGIFRGRDSIRRNLEDVLKLGLRNYSVRQTISREYGSYQFNVGEWEADFGTDHLHGYYSALLTTVDGATKIAEETVTVAVP